MNPEIADVYRPGRRAEGDAHQENVPIAALDIRVGGGVVASRSLQREMSHC
jgi:hypothetical protein